MTHETTPGGGKAVLESVSSVSLPEQLAIGIEASLAPYERAFAKFARDHAEQQRGDEPVPTPVPFSGAPRYRDLLFRSRTPKPAEDALQRGPSQHVSFFRGGEDKTHFYLDNGVKKYPIGISYHEEVRKGERRVVLEDVTHTATEGAGRLEKDTGAKIFFDNGEATMIGFETTKKDSSFAFPSLTNKPERSWYPKVDEVRRGAYFILGEEPQLVVCSAFDCQSENPYSGYFADREWSTKDALRRLKGFGLTPMQLERSVRRGDPNGRDYLGHQLEYREQRFSPDEVNFIGLLNQVLTRFV